MPRIISFSSHARLRCCLTFILFLVLFSTGNSAHAQDTVTGAFQGIVTDSLNGTPLKDALVEIINQQTSVSVRLKTDYRGRFFQGLLLPGTYIVRVSMNGYVTKAALQPLRITYTGEVVPVPVALDPAPPGTTPAPLGTAIPAPMEENDTRGSIITIDGRRSGSYLENEIVSLPIGGANSIRSFDELALLLPGVSPPPQTFGSVAGPGVGAGVGSAGQFSVNGLRSRGNNFTVDGSDNNDEDIGVRRQGFVALVPQPRESIREYQVITLLAPAQFGRNIGGQVNAVSKSGGSETHGNIYGRFNSSHLNARDFFDTADGNSTFPLVTNNGQAVLLNGQPLSVVNASAGEDSFTLGEGGFVLGGQTGLKNIFYFGGLEVLKINASKESHFAVPTIEERGGFGSGASGFFRDPFTGAATRAIPGTRAGSAIFNLFPFPNHPEGIYGRNTFTQVLPANARSVIGSAKLDAHFTINSKQQSLVERYNFTDDFRDIPVTGGALFSSLRPNIQTHNSSFFFNSEISAPNSESRMFNQVRFSFGRTRLLFDENRDREFLIPSAKFPSTPFLLNAPLRFNATQPAAAGQPNQGPVLFVSPISIAGIPSTASVEDELGPIGQVSIAGFSPVGVEVYNFPQSRVNNTYQLADEVTWHESNHAVAFGVDIRHTELNSELERNSRSFVTFNSSPRMILDNGTLRLPTINDPNPIVRAQDLAAFGAANNFFFTLNTAASNGTAELRFNQFNFYVQDSWRIQSNLNLYFGLRYEYNTPVSELNQRIENTFSDPALSLAPGIRSFIAGRKRIYDPDRDNFGPRVGLAYKTTPFGHDHLTVIRTGYGIFYDQILGAVATQSKNVYPTFLTLNFGGLTSTGTPTALTLTNPARTFISVSPTRIVPLQLPNTLNTYNPEVPLDSLLNVLRFNFPSALGATIPQRGIEMPMAQHYALTVEQMVNRSLVVAVAYVGTQGRHLLRFTTPNQGPGSTIAPVSFSSFQLVTLQGSFEVPEIQGLTRSPNRAVPGIGAIQQFETTANSHYNSLQVEARGRFRHAISLRGAYTFSNAVDDVSDVFDLAGAFVLPQNSLTFHGERGAANFDVRHRFVFSFILDLPTNTNASGLVRALTKGVQVGSTGTLASGQPFTVNSSIDVNLDGNVTDRLNNTTGLVQTGAGQQPLVLTNSNPLTLLAPFGEDGAVGRNTFRAGGLVDLNLAIRKNISFSKSSLGFTIEIFNLINRANFSVPVRILEAPGFGKSSSTITPGRRFELGLKYSF